MISANGGLPSHRYTPQVTQRWPRGSEPASKLLKESAYSQFEGISEEPSIIVAGNLDDNAFCLNILLQKVVIGRDLNCPDYSNLKGVIAISQGGHAKDNWDQYSKLSRDPA